MGRFHLLGLVAKPSHFRCGLFHSPNWRPVLVCREPSHNNLDGDAISQGLSDLDWSSTTSGAMAIYNDDLMALAAYGGLYNWYAVDDARGLCPSGWHVPTAAEWTILTNNLGGESAAGVLMKANYGWNNGDNGTNSSGFSGLPGGRRIFNGSFGSAGDGGFGGVPHPSQLHGVVPWSSTMGGSAAAAASTCVFCSLRLGCRVSSHWKVGFTS